MLGAELGHGVVDYKPIFAAAKKAGLQHYFAEQEGPFARMNQLQAAQVLGLRCACPGERRIAGAGAEHLAKGPQGPLTANDGHTIEHHPARG